MASCLFAMSISNMFGKAFVLTIRLSSATNQDRVVTGPLNSWTPPVARAFARIGKEFWPRNLGISMDKLSYVKLLFFAAVLP